MSGVISIRSAIVPELVAQARQEPHLECCGMLAGRDGVITHAFPAANVSMEPARNYEIEPKEIVRLMREFRTAGLEFLGIYHSHPNGKNEPSARDIQLAYYSEEAYFIVSPHNDSTRPVRAFHIRGGRASELEIQIVQ